jgi:hypothetical protein
LSALAVLRAPLLQAARGSCGPVFNALFVHNRHFNSTGLECWIGPPHHNSIFKLKLPGFVGFPLELTLPVFAGSLYKPFDA